MILVASYFLREPLLDLGDLRRRLTTFCEYVAWLADPAGQLPEIGDDDEGRVLTLCCGREATYCSSVALCVGARLAIPTQVSPAAAGAELRTAFFGDAETAAAPSGRKSFDVGGCSVVREVRGGRRMTLIVDHGPLGYLAIAAHGHADANSLILTLDDLPALVDPGAYLYHSGGLWRDWFRSTRAHNTLNLDSSNQSTIAGPFNWSQKARAWREHVEFDPWLIRGAHDGYSKRWRAVHVRTVAPTADGLLVHDQLMAADAAPAETVFQFSPDFVCEGHGQTWRATRGADGLNIEVFFSADATVECRSGEPFGAGGWVSPRFGSKVAAPRLAWRGQMAREGLTTRLRWNSA